MAKAATRRISNEELEEIKTNEELMQYSVKINSPYVALHLLNEEEGSVVIFNKNAKGEVTKATFQGKKPDFFKEKINDFLDKKVKKSVAFVVMRFLPEFDNWFNYLKEHLLNKHNIIAKRLDTERVTRILDHKLYDELDNCDLAIVNLSNLNENVAYEFGYLVKRFLNKEKMIFENIILVVNSNTDSNKIVFDINHIERIKYNSDSDDKFLEDIDNWIKNNFKSNTTALSITGSVNNEYLEITNDEIYDQPGKTGKINSIGYIFMYSLSEEKKSTIPHHRFGAVNPYENWSGWKWNLDNPKEIIGTNIGRHPLGSPTGNPKEMIKEEHWKIIIKKTNDKGIFINEYTNEKKEFPRYKDK